ncbi:MAG: hypothetical protein H6636_14265 [Anaerolineales bacterium]|nr:hypothetical protein [Anaerolineales bacterium]
MVTPLTNQKWPTGLLLGCFLVALLLVVALAMANDQEARVSPEEYQEVMEAADKAPLPPEQNCPFKLTRAQWDELQAQFERTPALGDTWAPSGEHYILVALLNRWNLFPATAEDALELAEFLLTYCLEN